MVRRSLRVDGVLERFAGGELDRPGRSNLDFLAGLDSVKHNVRSATAYVRRSNGGAARGQESVALAVSLPRSRIATKHGRWEVV